jgi:para-nitrobenzyl esterase
MTITTTALFAQPQVTTENGVLEGITNSGVRIFKGIPFAQPPVGDLRWKAPQPPVNWEGVRKAYHFGPRAMQNPIYGDMGFRSDGLSEDCLYLNVWTPDDAEPGSLPVLVYFYGGGFAAGDGSEDRYNGEMMARKGIVAVTVNYRLNVFGFLAHPSLTAESPNHASGNYGLMDQNAALKWVHANIAAFGGDPNRVTIAGESAGSFSVSAQMASPLSRGLFQQAIAESGSLLGGKHSSILAESEKIGEAFMANLGAKTVSEMRAIPAEDLLKALAKPDSPWFFPVQDGSFFDQSPNDVFADQKQAHVPLLVGWNNQEMDYHYILGAAEPTLKNYEVAVKQRYPNHWKEYLSVYHAETDADVEQVATDFASDSWIAYSTWKLADEQAKVAPVYRYYFCRARPIMRPELGNLKAELAGGVSKVDGNTPPPPARGAVHSAEIEYAMGNLSLNKVYNWTPDDYKVSATMQGYFANFIKSGNPNGYGLPEWAEMTSEQGEMMYMRIDVDSKSEKENNRERYLLLDQLSKR